VLTLLVLLAVVAILFGAAVVATQDDQVLADAPPDDADVELPTGRVVAEDLRAVRFGMVLRGYRMSEVDAVLARLGEELAARDERITDLERVLAEIVAPVVDELEAGAEAPEPASPTSPAPMPVEPDEEALAPASPPSLAPTLARGARAGEAPAEMPVPTPLVADDTEVAGEAPAEAPAPTPVTEDVSPAAAFTLPSEVTSLRMPLVEQELEATPETDLEPEVDVVDEAPLPELDGEPESEAEVVDEAPAVAPAPAPALELAEPFGAETLVEEPEPEPEVEPEPAGAEELESSRAAVADVFRESAVAEPQQTVAGDEAEPEAVLSEAVVVGDEPGVPQAFDEDDAFGFPEVLGADAADPDLPEAVEEQLREDEQRRPAEERRPEPPEPA
jgi:DivIVA domain-containing protein